MKKNKTPIKFEQQYTKINSKIPKQNKNHTHESKNFKRGFSRRGSGRQP